jgi:hypothetical protein
VPKINTAVIVAVSALNSIIWVRDDARRTITR